MLSTPNIWFLLLPPSTVPSFYCGSHPLPHSFRQPRYFCTRAGSTVSGWCTLGGATSQAGTLTPGCTAAAPARAPRHPLRAPEMRKYSLPMRLSTPKSAAPPIPPAIPHLLPGCALHPGRIWRKRTPLRCSCLPRAEERHLRAFIPIFRSAE